MLSPLAALLLAAFPAFAAWPWAPPAAELVYEIESTGKPSIDSALAEKAAAVVRKRLEAFGFDGTVERRADNRVVVTLRSREDPEAALRPLLKPAKLEFRLAFPEKTKPGAGQTTMPEYEIDAESGDVKTVPRVVETAARMTGADIAAARAALTPPVNTPEVHIEFGPAGTKKLAALTRESLGRALAVTVDGRVMSIAHIQSEISGGAMSFSGNLTMSEATDIARLLSGGALPVKLTLTRKVIGGVEQPLPAVPAAAVAAAPAPRTAKPEPAEAPAPVSDVDTAPASVRGRALGAAVVIGVERTRQGLPRADYAAKDARVFAEYLVKTLGYREQDVVLLLDERANRSDLAKYLEDWLPKRVPPGGTAVVFFSGHGAPDPARGKAYLVPYDGDPAFLEKTAYPMAKLTEDLAKLQGRKAIVLVDACFSGAGRRSALPKGARPLVTRLEPVAPVGEVAVLSAAAADQIGGAYDEKGHGLFTYFVLSALRDAASAGRVPTVSDLFDSVGGKVEAASRRLTGNEQTPQLQAAGAARGHSL